MFSRRLFPISPVRTMGCSRYCFRKLSGHCRRRQIARGDVHTAVRTREPCPFKMTCMDHIISLSMVLRLRGLTRNCAILLQWFSDLINIFIKKSLPIPEVREELILMIFKMLLDTRPIVPPKNGCPDASRAREHMKGLRLSLPMR